jgi:hypothetical protein
MWRDYSGFLGYGENFGTINSKDINELDLSKPIPEDLQLVAEVMFHSDYYSPSVFHSENYFDEAKSVFGSQITKQFSPVESALNYAYGNRNYVHPVNEESLRAILADRFVNFDSMRDPWGTPYKPTFSIDKTRDILTIVCAGPDKQFDTRDDFTLSQPALNISRRWERRSTRLYRITISELAMSYATKRRSTPSSAWVSCSIDLDIRTRSSLTAKAGT